MAFGFVNVPALIGIGRYNVTLDLPASGGLYPTSVVTYRGIRDRQGHVHRRHPRRCARVLKLDSSTKIPSDVSAAVHSRSAVGEQFVELTPERQADDTSRHAARRRRHPGRQDADPARYRKPARRHQQGAAGDPAGQSAHRRRRSRQGGRAGSGPNCPASSTDRHRWRSRRARPVTRSPS